MTVDCPRPHSGSHLLAWEHGVDRRLRAIKLWQHVEMSAQVRTQRAPLGQCRFGVPG